jgi:hypothetical protein
MNPTEEAARRRSNDRHREHVARHEAAHLVAAKALGAKKIEAAVQSDMGWYGITTSGPLAGSAREQVALKLAGVVATRASWGATLKPREVSDVLELEGAGDLARKVEADPSLGRAGLELAERIVWGNLGRIESVTEALVARSQTSASGTGAVYIK